MSDTLVAGGSGWAFNPSDAAFRSDPYPRCAEIREASEPPRTRDGLRVLTRHAAVLAALRDPRLSSDPRQAFTPWAVGVLRPRVQELVEEMLDSVRDAGECDLMSALAEPLPVMVICPLLGVPPTDRDQFKPWSSAIGRVLDPDADATTFEQAVPAIMGFVGYFAQLIEERRARPREELLSSLIEAESHGETLTAQDLFAMVILLFIAGHETTTNLIGNGTLALLRHRAQLEALNAAPDLVQAGVEELLRDAEMALVDDDPHYRDHFVLRGLAALPVSLSGR